MKTLRFTVAIAIALGSVSAFATNARVESMGKSTTFIMDDMSIFDNPANINLYPNFLIGELGHYTGPGAEGVAIGKNQDPFDPWFGGIFSLDIGAGRSLSIAGVLNRKNERLLKYFPNKVTTDNYPEDGKFDWDNGFAIVSNVPNPVTNFDGFLGANLDNIALGVHVYIAHQDGLDDYGNISSDAFASAFQLDAGTNIEISDNYAIEFSGGIARIQYGPSEQKLFDPKLLSIFGSARLFSRLPAINGHLIPAASLYNMNALGREELEINGGIGLDAAFDRGFFWMGLNGFYSDQKADSRWVKNMETGETLFIDNESKKDIDGTRLRNIIGATIGFGIERNIWWDWFLIRVGGQKTIAYAKYAAGKAGNGPYSVLCPSKSSCKEDGNYFVSNPVNDGTKGDLVGFGIGVNIEEKLKIDAAIAEDFLFRNPFQGEGRLISRISATYSF
ncbi:MAG: hypothetical protein LBH25_13885 [Fibromonadaceae bacterium]|jgi:hypothetical protein|nr:hypothetical protein [Fibromonadaceae bacterium]